MKRSFCQAISPRRPEKNANAEPMDACLSVRGTCLLRGRRTEVGRRRFDRKRLPVVSNLFLKSEDSAQTLRVNSLSPVTHLGKLLHKARNPFAVQRPLGVT